MLVVYTAAIFVSALLLFSVQPLFTKMVLPRLGGSPAVWSVAMVFFQSLLLGGYAYAHYPDADPQPRDPGGRASGAAGDRDADAAAVDCERLGRSADVGLCILAVGPVRGRRSGCRSSRSPPTTRCCRPGSSAPAIPSGPDPYFLYASSNIGSFLALLSYPVLLEPMFTLRTQNLIWTGGYGLLIVLIAACGVLLLRSPANAAALNMPDDDADAPAPSWMLARALDLSRRGAVGSADRGDRAYLHRRRRRAAAAVGAAAVALSADLGAGVPVAAAAAAQMDAAGCSRWRSPASSCCSRSAANRTCC